MRVIGFSILALLCFTVSVAIAARPDPVTDEQKALYAIGLAISDSLGSFTLSESELEFVKAGLTDGVLKRPRKVDLQAMTPKIQQLQQTRAAAVAEAEKKAGAAFLAKAAESGAKKTASGAIVTTLKEGSGATPKATDTVKVHYHGMLLDGTVFDSSVK
ncbi:MAG TPA: FKBP-type peptidyl-prolyl cis-trans isomerase N-terminal domain-containing protein [Nitrospiraceae bacterium]|jgi:FKBP-type peptidyl-prolyl cis-trans isomerase FkpA/FKBP-type peptidyl-prolyl cis-trans isomerase FklB|nr:FKBP-type peptidyl-prolyl cis-trans isomerase N-terminal domain-containing protein [Nitrospiraceae bacterium]